jgi:hypothetical protein
MVFRFGAQRGRLLRERRQFTGYSAVACGWFSISCYFGALALRLPERGWHGPGRSGRGSSSAPRGVLLRLGGAFTSSGMV